MSDSYNFLPLVIAVVALTASPLFARDARVAPFITIIAGARVADEMCPTTGRQEEGWTKLSNIQSEEFAGGDFENGIAKEADMLRPSMAAREGWCDDYRNHLRSDLMRIARTPEYKSNHYVRAAVCELREDYLQGKNCND